MKKILIFSLAYYPSFVSGAEAAVKETTDRISEKDFEFHMLTLLFEKSASRYERIGNVHVHRVGFGGTYISKILFIPLAVIRARTLHKENKFSAFWALMTYMLFPTALLRLSGVRVPIILTLQDGDPYEKVFERWFIRLVSPLLNYGFRRVSMVHAISEHLAMWPAKRGYRGPIEVIHNGANPKNLAEDYDQREVEILRTKFGKQEGDMYLLNAARLVHQKANDVVIKALTLLPSNVHFIVIGSGPDEKMLKELAKEKRVAERVHFIGQLDRQEVVKYRNRIFADIFVCPSRSEGLGNSFLSAMAARLPVIATQEGGLAEFIFDERRNPDKETTAWAVDADSPEQIASAVTDIMEHPEKVKVVTEHARAMVFEKYNWDVIAEEMQKKIFDVATS